MRASSRRATRLPTALVTAGRVGRTAIGVPSAAAVAVGAYLGANTVVAWAARGRGRHRTSLPAAPRHRFVVLVPAHDEERLIASTMKSLTSIDYPADLVRVHVVCDNCTDATATIVREHGVEAHERTAPDAPGKGPALGWLLDRLRARGDAFDAVVIVDADTTVSANLLRVADAHLAAGAEVVQAYYAVRDPAATATTAFRAAGLACRHYLRPLARTWLGGSAGLFGNGMVFSAATLERLSFSNHLVEDIEFQLTLLMDGVKVAFAPDAVVEAEMPTTLEGAATQQQRWERGRVEMVRRFVPGLARRAVTGGPAGRYAYAEAAVDQLLPPFSLVVLGTVGALGLATVRVVLVPTPAARRAFVLALAAAALQAGYVLSGLKLVGAPPSVYRALAGAPRQLTWKARLWLRVVRGGEGVSWTRTARNDDQGGAA